MQAKKHKEYFDADDVPYVTLAQKTMDCLHKVDRQVKVKQKRKELKTERKVRDFSNKSQRLKYKILRNVCIYLKGTKKCENKYCGIKK